MSRLMRTLVQLNMYKRLILTYLIKLIINLFRTHCETFEKCVSNDAEGVPVFHDGLAVLGAFVELDSQMNEKDINDRLRVLLTKANWLDNAGIDDQDLNKNGDFSLGYV